uniref:Integrase catalytic domain-containing protein n=1 Tax=Tanacetum cinerariifolium TaxID=118510 RepID=A0A6L2LHY3_TANCI|nr:hypothetical protein [Tanacetum cinerariifolium]
MKDRIKWGQFRKPLLKAQKEHLSSVQNDLESTLTCLLKNEIVDHLALMSNVSNPQRYSPSSFTSSSIRVPQHLADNSYLDSSISLTENLIEDLTNKLALLTQSYKTFLPQTNNQLQTSSNARKQATADDCDAFDSDMDEAPTAQTMLIANLSSADPVTDEAGPSYDSDILSEVQDHDHHQNAVCAHHEEHPMHDSVQLDHVVNSHADYTSDSNMISYGQYVKDNEVLVVHSNVSFVPNNAFMMIYNDMCEPHAQSVSNPSRNTVVKKSLTAELATYKEQVKLPKPYYNELNKVAIGYKNPLCLTRAKQVQPALYNGHEIIKDNHALAIVHNTEDTLEIAEITRKKMNDKMKDPECVIRKARCLKLEAELTNLRNTSHHDNQEELINRSSKLEVNHLNLQFKYQNLKDSFENNPPTPNKDTPNFGSVFVIGKIQASLQGKDNVIRQLKKKISHLQVTRSDTDRTLKVRTANSQITKLAEQVTNLQAQNNLFRTESDKIKQHYKELYDSIKITRAKHTEQVTALTTENVNLKAQTQEKVNSVSKDQTSNTLHNAIMEVGGKDRPPMLAPGNYVHWKSIIKRYIDTKPNHELIHYCLKNPPYKYTWKDKDVPVTKGESINVQDLKTNLYWEFGKFTSRDGESLESYYLRFYKMMNELVRNQCDVTNHQVNVQFLLQLQLEWRRFVTLVKQSQELKTVSYHKLYDILKQPQNEVNEIRAERLACTANQLALVTQQQSVYHPQNHPTHYTQNSSTRTQQAATRNRGKAIVNSPLPIYDQEPSMVVEDDEMSKDKKIDKLMALISLSFKKIYKPNNNNGFGNVARECQKPKWAKDAAYHKEKMLLCKQEEAGFQLNADQADWRDDTDDEFEDQELKAHYMYMAQIQKNVFVIESEHPKQSKSVHDTYLIEQDEHNVIIDSLDMSYNREQIDQDDDNDDDLANERDLLASLIEKLKCEIDDNKNRNKFLETSNKVLVEKLKGQIEDFKTKNKSLESSNNHFKEANNELSKTNELMYKDLEKFQTELDRYNDVKINADLEKFHLCLKEEMVADLRYFNSLELEVDSLKSQLETQKTQFLNEIDQLSREYYYADHMNAILGKPTIFSDSLERKDCSKSKSVSKNNVSNDFSKPVTAQILPPNKKSILKNTNVLASGMYKLHTKPIQTRTTQLPYDFRKTNKRMSFSTGVIPATSVSKPQLKSNRMKDRVMLNNSQGKKQEVEDHRRNVKFSKNKTYVTACNDSLNAKTSNVNFVCATCGKCVLNEKHDMCVLKSLNGVNSRTKMPMVVPIVLENLNASSTNLLQNPLGEQLLQNPLVEIILFIVDSGCSKHMTGNLKLLTNFVEKFLGMVKFGNDQIAPILGYGDLGNDLLTGSRETNLYSITLQDTSSPNPICLMAKATSSQAWLWHCRLSHLNFDTINLLLKNDIVIGLPKLKFVKDHLCSSCELGKAKRKSFQTKTTPSSKRWLQLLHMDLCDPMSKDETPEVLIDFLRLVQRGLHAQVRIVRTDKGTEFLNKTLHAYFASEGINHQMSVSRKPEQNGVVERWNRTLVEAARTMLSTVRVPQDGENLDKMKEKGDACIFVGYSTLSRSCLIFNKITRVIVETIHVNFDEVPQMASDHVNSDPVPQCQRTALEHDSLSLGPQCQENVPHAAGIVTTSNELDLLFSLMFDELLNGYTQVVSKSSAVTTADTLNKCQQQHTTPLNTQTTPDHSCQVPTHTNCLVQDRGETSSRHVDSSNMHTFYQSHPSEHRWTKDHSLEQVIRNPSQSVRTRCQLESDGEICMFALTVSQTKPKNIKEAMADSAWIESMQEELYQFDRLDIWELVDKPLCKNVINMKWL